MADQRNTEQAINATIRFLRVIRHTHSPETNAQVYNSLKPILGKEVMDHVLKQNLTTSPDRKIVIWDIPLGSRVQVLRCIREYTGCGYTHAKLFIDNVVRNGIKETIPEQDPDNAPYTLDDLKTRLISLGVTCSEEEVLTG